MRKWQKFKLSSIVTMFILNIFPIIFGTIRLSEGGKRWGGEVPFVITLSFISMLVCGVLGFFVFGSIFYQLYMNRKYIGSKGAIRALIVLVIFYFTSGTMGSISTNKYASSNGTASCTLSKLNELWGSAVFQQGKQAYANFCGICKCHISKSVQEEFANQKELLAMNYNSFFGANNISECDPREGQLNNAVFDQLKSMEMNYQCAGFCSSNPVYTFYGISKGLPKKQKGCFSEVSYEMFENQIMFLVINMTIGGLSIVSYFLARSLRIDRMKEIMVEHGIDPYQRFDNGSFLGDSHDDWRAGDPYSSMGQQRSNTSNGKNDEKLDQNKVEQLRIVRRAFRSMHNTNPSNHFFKK